jgi:hypothetical protein
MKMSTIVVGARASVSAYSVVLYDTALEEGATLGACSLLMKGESLPRWTNWQGLPAKRFYDLDTYVPDEDEAQYEDGRDNGGGGYNGGGYGSANGGYAPAPYLNTPEVIRRAMANPGESPGNVHSMKARS